MKFFFDNTISPFLAEAIDLLQDRQHPITPLRNKFSPDTPDESWLPVLGKEGQWIIISGDINITRNPQRKKILKDTGLSAFILFREYNRMGIWEQSWRLIRWWPRLVQTTEHSPRGKCFEILNKSEFHFREILL